ncbi:hypothetical protein PQX77_020668 [Marasmius sp. AFHP31]|nr:hypothetical protein PQX77_020668 [Marasmius sp. AFHP31]
MRLPSLDLATSSLHYWSFDTDGHSKLSDHLCNELGLPLKLRLYPHTRSYTWPNGAYSSLRQYQLLRGFNTSTADFARSLGFDENIYQPLSDSDQFAEVTQESPLDNEFSASIVHAPASEDTPTRPTQQSLEHAISTTGQPIGFWSPIFLPPPSKMLENDSDTPAQNLNRDNRAID